MKTDSRARDSKEGYNISTSGVKIMASMPVEDQGCSSESRDSESDHERPGYRICSYVERFIDTDAGPIPVVTTALGRRDLLSTFAVRCGVNRHNYTVTPGLYAVGEPDKTSEVLVTSNFKLTFDHLRKELAGVSAWILVLDTRGINVWCAASKGTFSTAELVKRIQASSLEKIVDHKRVVVPQLGATGVAAREVKNRSGFRVVYGPIRARDIRSFLRNDKKADKEMRQVSFTMYERFILTPVEIQMMLKPALVTVLLLFVISGFGPGIFSVAGSWQRGMASVIALAAGIVSGAFVTPVLLPFIPSKIFALKGIITGAILSVPVLALVQSSASGAAGLAALWLFSVTVSSYTAMNFTGATPFTSPSGVEKEMKRFIPVQSVCILISLGVWIYSAF